MGLLSDVMDQTVVEQIGTIVGENNYSTRIADRYTYGFDASIHHVTPDVVVQPRSTEQVSRLVKLANKLGIPIVPRGAGTGLCGGAVPLKGGMVIDLTRMNRSEEVRVEDLYCVCEAGVVYDSLQKALAPYKFTFPPTPGSAEACTIGGMVACNASGMRAVKYGGTRDYVLGLEVVLPTGEIIEVGTRTLKNASGYQLERLFVGSEGTLGIGDPRHGRGGCGSLRLDAPDLFDGLHRRLKGEDAHQAVQTDEPEEERDRGAADHPCPERIHGLLPLLPHPCELGLGCRHVSR